MLDAEAMRQLAAHCRAHGRRLAFLDTWTALSPTADPLNAKDQAALATVVTTLAEAIEGVVVVVDHARKNPDDGPLSTAEIFGPSQKAQRAEHMVLLRRLKDDPRRVEVFIDSKDLD